MKYLYVVNFCTFHGIVTSFYKRGYLPRQSDPRKKLSELVVRNDTKRRGSNNDDDDDDDDDDGDVGDGGGGGDGDGNDGGDGVGRRGFACTQKHHDSASPEKLDLRDSSYDNDCGIRADDSGMEPPVGVALFKIESDQFEDIELTLFYI
ncbi:hypothetical protein V1478_018659 [Vespula squamosa]|uniref:Uncharacterized protein n=1 Tax=Vespula squamosa TaxID=30214 RepID=A0ABD1ZTF3_VESSQ